jgi:hypothetical protein
MSNGLASLLLLLVSAWTIAAAQAPSTPHWRETDTETLWTGRYSNCDYGSYVVLPSGIVGHDVRSPAPNHGFVINLAAPPSTEPFDATASNRYIDVYNFYDVEDHGESTSATLDYYLTIGEIGNEDGVQRLSSAAYTLTGLSAKRVTTRWTENGTVMRRDRILAYRRAGGILYQLTLQSPEKDFSRDEQVFERVVAGFHVSKLSNGECSND